MAKFALHGGILKDHCESNDQFFSFMADNMPEGGIWLQCNFARESLDAEQQVFERDCSYMQKMLNGKSINLELAKRDIFQSQVEKADVVMLNGGSIVKLLTDIKNACPNIKEILLHKKVVAGSSAGACVLCRDFIEDNPYKAEEGLNIIPFGAVVHYCEKNNQYPEQNNLKHRKQPLIMIHEKQFCVIDM